MLDNFPNQGWIYTVGHSTHSMDKLIWLLHLNGIEVLVDSRSSPFSARVPHFDRDLLSRELPKHGIKYLYMGSQLGGRPEGSDFYDEDGRVLYWKVAQGAHFQDGIERLKRGAKQYKVTVLCSEENPTNCHRRLLIGRVLLESGYDLMHIRSNGDPQSETELAQATGTPLYRLLGLGSDINWKSTQSVLRKDQPRNSSLPYGKQVFGN